MKLYSFLILTTLLVSAKIYADQPSDCSQIADTTDRLECFDRAFPKQNAELPNVESKVIASPSSADSADTVREPGTDMPAQEASAQQADKKQNKSRLSLGGLFDWKSQPAVETEIAAIRAGSKQRMVFRLANGQIWMQSTPRALPFKAGDKVTIKSGRIGGHIMRSASGTSSRVRLIEG